MLDSLLAWTEATLMPLGFSGVGLLAFMESAFFPIPPEVLLFPAILLDPTNAFGYALVATVFSTLGSLLGWNIGKAGGKPLLKKFVKKENISKATKLFKKYGPWTLVISGFTPIPYKVFTITAGALDYDNMTEFLVACTIGRGFRFFLEAALLWMFGEQILYFVEKEFAWAALIVVIVVVAAYLAMQRLRSKRR